MKELLYKKSEAVAALNRVDGFHPMELARKIKSNSENSWDCKKDWRRRAGGAALSGCEIPEAMVSSGQSGRKDHQPDYHFHREHGSCGSTYLSG